MATLTVSHNIFLTRDERYRLHKGEKLIVTGVSVPVWFKKGSTSEPAQEVFCTYELTNEPGEKPISTIENGYLINLPQKSEKSPASSIGLLDINDGGSEWVEFRQYNTVYRDGKKYNLVHFVEVKPIELLN
jgi:hypothetical protein